MAKPLYQPVLPSVRTVGWPVDVAVAALAAVVVVDSSEDDSSFLSPPPPHAAPSIATATTTTASIRVLRTIALTSPRHLLHWTKPRPTGFTTAAPCQVKNPM